MLSDEKLGSLIKQRREEKEITQDSFAELLGVSKATISLYESGIRRPTLDRIYKIADILEIPLPALLEFEVPKENLEIALRAHGISGDDIQRVKDYINLINKASKSENLNGAK